jgi:16S rRNA (guanine527-N7)-methyltransferase
VTDEPGAAPGVLAEVLAESARLGFLGPGDVSLAMDHAAGFLGVLRPASRLLDLGSGGGLPGLVLAERLPESEFVLLDASVTRTDFLRRAVGRLGWGDRVRVVAGRAELVVRSGQWRRSVDAVVSRSFGPPAVTAECAAPFLRVAGQLVVSEPPEGTGDRWPRDALAMLGLVPDGAVRTARYVSFTQAEPCPSRFPRRALRPALF